MTEKLIKEVLQNEEGQSMVEYSLIIALMVVFTLGALKSFADSEKGYYDVIIDKIIAACS